MKGISEWLPCDKSILPMETELWKTLPEELLYMILARLPIRVFGKMKTVCKKWKYLLSSRDALQVSVPNWSLHSIPGFLLQFQWKQNDDAEYWGIEGSFCDIYKLPFFDHIVVDTCKSMFCCHRKGDKWALSVGNPATRNWRNLPRPPTSGSAFSGMAFDSSTGRCTLLFGDYYFNNGRQQGESEGGDIRILMSIYDSQSNAWIQVSRRVPYHIQPCGKGIYSNGKFYWVCVSPNPRNLMVAFNIANGVWTEIPLPQRYRMNSYRNLSGYIGQVLLAEQTGRDRFRIWKLDEAEKFGIWCELITSSLVKCIFPCFCSVTVNSYGLIMVIDSKTNISIYNSKGEVIAGKMKLPGLRRAQLPNRISVSVFESNNLWYP